MNIKIAFWFMMVVLASVLSRPLLATDAGEPDYARFKTGSGPVTVIVSGSNRGLGLGWVTHYLQQGASVIATCRTPAEAKALHELQAQHMPRLLIDQLDVEAA